MQGWHMVTFQLFKCFKMKLWLSTPIPVPYQLQAFVFSHAHSYFLCGCYLTLLHDSKRAVIMSMPWSFRTLNGETFQTVVPADRLDSKWVLTPPAA